MERLAATAWEEREDWLSLLSELFDPRTIERLESLGVEAGAHALEAGAGGGSIAVWLARRVGTGGRVVATDTDTRFLDRIGEPNLEVLRHDLLVDEFPPESFDLIHARAVLVHLSDGERAVERMVRWLRPGGVLLAEEPWVDASLLSLDPAMALLAEALEEFMDGGLAPRLPMVLRRCGLERIGAEGELAFFNGGSKLAAFNRLALERQLDELVAKRRIDREDGERMLARFADPAWSAWSRPRLAAWGWKPGARRAARGRAKPSAAGRAPADVERSIPERFEERARRDPEKTAIAGGGWEPSFSELDAAANRIAGSILERGDGPGERVALVLRHNAPLFAAALAALKADRTAVVLNPSDPPERLGRIRSDTEPALAICASDTRELALGAGFGEADLLSVPERPDSSPHPAPGVAVSPGRLAHLIYTSGSTGEPKGVMQTHRNVLHNVMRQANGLDVSADDRVALLASLSGGQGVGVTWTALLSGATLLPFPAMERGVTGLAPWLEEQRATVLCLSASVFRHFVRTLEDRMLDGIRLVRLGSEQATRADFEAYRRHFGEPCVLANLLSSSETGNISQCLLRADSEVGSGALPVGRPAEGMEVRLLDEHGADVPPGEVGELVVSSRYLSPGYWRAGAGNGDGSIDDAGEPRTFRTGDLARAGGDGSLTVVGRGDDRVKILGNRLELLEVEAAIGAVPEVASAAVLPDRTSRGETRLTAFVVPRPEAVLDRDWLRRRLRGSLQRHSIPTAFVFLERLPLNAHGKLDRPRLAELAGEARRQPGHVPPRGETEEILAGIWADVFDLEHVGRDDDFFALDGDSLLAAEIAAEVASAFGVEIQLQDVSEARTLAELAAVVERFRSRVVEDPLPPLVRASRSGPLPASFAQESLWRQSRIPAESLPHNVSLAVRITGQLDLGALRSSLDDLFRRHEILRTTFAERDGRLVQVIHEAGPVELPLIEPARDARAAGLALLDEQAGAPFDVERGPLVRLLLVRVSANEHLLIRSNHHIISDGPSWEIFFEQLGPLYEAHLAAEPPPPEDPVTLQFADFAAWQRRIVRPGSPRYLAELEWWRRELAGCETPKPLPFARPMTAAAASESRLTHHLRPSVAGRLNRLGREAGATHHTVRLALFAAQLAVETETRDPVVSIPKSNRAPRELRGTFGPLYDLTFLRLAFTPEVSFREWLGRVRAGVAGSRSHSLIPHEQVLEALGPELGFPGAQLTFSESSENEPPRFADLEITSVRRSVQVMPRGFYFDVHRTERGDRIWAMFDARFYDPAGVHAFAARFRSLAAVAGRHPDRPIGELVAAAARRAERRSSAPARFLRRLRGPRRHER